MANQARGARHSKSGEHRRADGVRTRARLLDVAEELFADLGVEAVSVRSVNAAAGLAPASVHYHFRDKDGLVRAVIARRGEMVIRRQAELLAQIERLRRRPRAEEVVRLLADPFHDLLRREPTGGARWLTIVADLVAANDERVYQVGFGPGSVQERINRCAAAAFPALPEPEISLRWRLASTALLQLMASSAPVLATDAGDREYEVIVGFVAAGLAGVCVRKNAHGQSR
ncbi:MAG: TetR/AcrR family transcriptional regulator [Acidimicrobiales bacterium]|nr:TetR/AcrR family transcriptional regulator [Acidimicrobiales bacterium]